jgi:UDP-N-acetylglucosamine--N-acetylmuramyl-(pentapeptide) pyrophosphoryl-undecaprenol N-acetylglucosamine transferase
VKPIVIAAGGTGGHFFPAEALATELVDRGHRVALMTDARAAAKLPDSFEGREVFVLRGAGIAGRGLMRGLTAAARLAAGTLQARSLLLDLQPAVIVGFGGYPTVAPVTATRLMRNAPPVVLHEQNAVLGRANRAMAGRAAVIALSFASTTRIPAGTASVVTGNPVRTAFTSLTLDAAVTEELHLLVLGGSLGARVFSDAVPAALASLPAGLRARLRVVQQCRPEDLQRVGVAYAASGIQAELASFFTDIPARLAVANLVIARAGASTMAELAVAGRPAILVPLPGAIDDHQTANAQALAQAGGAWVIAQSGIDALGSRLAVLLADPAALTKAGQAARIVARRDAAARLADLVLQHARVHP